MKATVLVIVCLVAIASRLLPHPPNWTAISATAIFGAAIGISRWSLLLSLIPLLIADVSLQILISWDRTPPWIYATQGIHVGMWVVYPTTLLIACLGRNLQVNRNWYRIWQTAVSGATIFFFVTNFAVWVGCEEQYPQTAEGLWQCYQAALPFYGWTVLGDLTYTGLFFGAYQLVERPTRAAVAEVTT